MPHRNGMLAKNDRRQKIEANLVKLRRERRRRAFVQFEMGTAKFLRYERIHGLRKNVKRGE